MKRVGIVAAVLVLGALLWAWRSGWTRRAPRADAPDITAGGPAEAPPAAAPARAPAGAPDGVGPGADESAGTAWIEGRVLDAPAIPWDLGEVPSPDPSTAAPLEGAVVRACTPPQDMRQARCDAEARFLEVRTDARGGYALAVPVPEGGVRVSLDALARGHVSAARSFHTPRECADLELAPGERKTVDFFLERAIYVAGRVVDPDGAPVAGVQITGTRHHARGGYSYEAFGITDAEGRFALYDMPAVEAKSDPSDTARVDFEHPSFRPFSLPDAYALRATERADLRVVLDRGHRVTGTLVDPSGAPVAGVLVALEYADYHLRRAAITGEAGDFALEGLSPGEAELRAFRVADGLWLRRSLDVRGDDLGARFTLRRLAPEDMPAGVEVVGMQVADVTPALREAFAVHEGYHVVVLNPGPEAERLGLPGLESGDFLWKLNRQELGDVRQLVAGLLPACGKTATGLVYGFRRPHMAGNRTTSIRLQPSDAERLKATLATLE